MNSPFHVLDLNVLENNKEKYNNGNCNNESGIGSTIYLYKKQQ